MRGAARLTAVLLACAAGLSAAAGSAGGVLPAVRLTPRDVAVAGLEESRVSLNGVWEFAPEVAGGFGPGAAADTDWHPVTVPGHPALEGFALLPKDLGSVWAWRRGFTLPAEWDGSRVLLRFEGIDGCMRVWVNGNAVGGADLAMLPGEFDVTGAVVAGGDNQVLLTLEKSLTTWWSQRELGGLTREVYVQALPRVNLARLHVDTAGDPADATATLNARLRVANDSDGLSGAVAVRFALEPVGDAPAAELRGADAWVPLPRVGPGQMLEVAVPLEVRRPAWWTAETPSLYRLTGELSVDGATVMSARQRFGFRTVAIDGPSLLVNGAPVKLWGTQYHLTYPGRGQSVPAPLIRRDLELFHDANFNSLRVWPTPSTGYADLCDELGLYTTVEAMMNLMIYAKGPLGDHGADPSVAGPYRHALATMIESYYSNPSVIAWGLGNECPYYDYFRVGALGVHAADPTRPRFFGSDNRVGVGIPWVDLNDDHYPRGGRGKDQPHYATVGADDVSGPVTTGEWDYPDDRPQLFTEWLHVHTNNWKEIGWDPGIDDRWGVFAAIHAEHLAATPQVAGGFQFMGAPFREIGADPIWRGIFDEDRRPNGLFWHVKKSHSPVRITATRGAVRDGSAVFAVENRYDFLDLAELTFAWRCGTRHGEVHPAVRPRATGELVVPAVPVAGGVIELEVRSPGGRTVDRYRLTVE